MACTPLAITAGTFFNTAPLAWSNAPSTTQGGKTVTRTSAGISVTGPTGTMPFHATVASRQSKYMFIGSDNYLLILDSDTGVGPVTHSVSLVDFTTSPPTERFLFSALTSGSAVSSPHVHPSPGTGSAFLIFSPTNNTPGLNTVSNIAIHRSSNGQVLCSTPPFNPSLQLTAEATATELRIKHGGTSIATCPMPSGSLAVTPSTQVFPDVRVGGCPVTPPTRQFTLRNTGDDCLTISAIANSGPFSVAGTSRPLPAALAPNETLTVDIRFTPTVIGVTGPMNLAITRSPARGHDHLVCRGQGVAPVVQVSFNLTTLNFGAVPVGAVGGPLTLHVRNTGGAPLAVTVPGPPLGASFQWTGFTGTLNCGADQPIAVTFSPTTEGTFGATMSVTSGAPGSPHSISLIGQGCIPNASIVVPPAPFPSFGDVQQGFRSVRFIAVQNTGDGPLTFTARVDGPDAGLFGLQPPSGSITDVLPIRNYTVEPTTPCGPGSTGTGRTSVAVTFFANATPPHAASANLIIEGHNATNTTTASWTFPLSANIVAPIAVDATLVLDRSGSMTDPLGTRTKSEAEIAGARLFAQLIRPDLDDRLAIVKFDDVPDVLEPLTHVTGGNQAALVNRINSTELAPRNGTSIAAGVMVGLPLFAALRPTPPPQLTKAMVVLTDGMDNVAYQNPADGRWYSVLGGTTNRPGGGTVATDPFPLPADIKIYGIGLGRAADIDINALNRLSAATGAYQGVVGDLAGPAYFSLEKYFVQIYMDIVGTSGILDPLYTIAPGQKHHIEYDVLRGDVAASIVVFDYQGIRLPFHLESPRGEIIDATSVPPGFQLRTGATGSARFLEYKMPLSEPDRYAGRWAVVVEHRGEVCLGLPEPDRDGRPGFLPKECRQFKDPVIYGVAIGVGSNFRMQPFVTPSPVYVGDPILLSAQVSEAGLPVTGCQVTVKAVSPGGSNWSLTLADDGSHEDGDADDGEYGRRFTQTAEEGSYEFTFRSVGLSRDGEPVTREAVRSKYVTGHQTGNPDPGSGGQPGGGELDPCCKEIIALLERQNDLLTHLVAGKRGNLVKSDS